MIGKELVLKIMFYRYIIDTEIQRQIYDIDITLERGKESERREREIDRERERE